MAETTEIAVRARTIASIFSSFDPSPFREKDIDAEVESYVVGWARELPTGAPFTIAVYVPPEEATHPHTEAVAEAFARYFTYRAGAAQQELRELFRIGRRSVLIGLVVLIACLAASQLVAGLFHRNVVGRILEEGLIIIGWVANWRPLEIFLYDWLPIRRRILLYRRVAAAPVEVRISK